MAVGGKEETGRAVVRRLVCFVVTAASTLRDETEVEGEKVNSEEKLSVVSEQRFLSFLKISVIADSQFHPSL